MEMGRSSLNISKNEMGIRMKTSNTVKIIAAIIYLLVFGVVVFYYYDQYFGGAEQRCHDHHGRWHQGWVAGRYSTWCDE